MEIERTLPHDLEAERAVLGAVLLDSKAIHVAADLLAPGDFYLEAHRGIFARMIDLAVESMPIDVWTLKSELERRGQLEAVGGLSFVGNLTEGIPAGANIKHYCKIVRERSLSRSIIHLTEKLQAQAWAGEGRPRELLEEAQSELLALYGREQEGGLRPMSEVVDAGLGELELRKSGGSGRSVLTGLVDIDQNTGGLRQGDLVILAARPGQGKSALAVNIALNAALRHKKRVAIFSMEMGQTQIYDRMLASEERLNCFSLSRGLITKSDWVRIVNTSSRLSASPIWIDDSGSLSMMQIRARATRQAAEHALDLIVIDYLQLIQGPGRSIYERVTEVSRGLKILAKDLKVPVLALSQLHRLQDEMGEPKLSDLRETGALEQDADVVLFLWPSKVDGLKQFRIAKQRNGPLATIDLGWIAGETRFADVALREDDENS